MKVQYGKSLEQIVVGAQGGFVYHRRRRGGTRGGHGVMK